MSSVRVDITPYDFKKRAILPTAFSTAGLLASNPSAMVNTDGDCFGRNTYVRTQKPAPFARAA